ncbi:hypothetical protein BZK35_26355 [Escherichia coli]|nr:hypothetical protein BZK35_26355 [Escherichia coli]
MSYLKDIRSEDVGGFAPIFPDICYHLTHYKPAEDDGRSLPKRRSTAPSMTSCTVSLLKPPVVTAQCSATEDRCRSGVPPLLA